MHNIDKLQALFKLIINEAKTNNKFALSITQILDNNDFKKTHKKRDASPIDPILLAEQNQLNKDTLMTYTEKELKDIIAEYNMDNKTLAMKWKNKDRLIDLIINFSNRRANKGNAFRS